MEMRMQTRHWRGRALAMAVGFFVAGGIAAQTPAPSPAPVTPPAKAAKAAKKPAAPAFKLILEPKAMDLLKAMSARLAAAKTMSFTAAVGYEHPTKPRSSIVSPTRSATSMPRPAKLQL